MSFCDPYPQRCSILGNLSRREWERSLRWLDISGLALYFLHRMIELRLSNDLPEFVLARLRKNLEDNAERTQSMIAESIAIQREFQCSSISYAVLKGLSLWPSSVPAPELRSQFDLDFLIAERDASRARSILEQSGYRLYHASRRSLEFKRNEKPGLSLKDLYKAQPSHAVELHIEPDRAGHPTPLDRIEMRTLYGCEMPVLSSIDLLLGQGLHAYKHVCSEFSRASHLLEFRRHVLAHFHDSDFWAKLQTTAENNTRASLGLGVVTLLITHVMGDFGPRALTKWTVHSLPESAHLWINRYGKRAVLGNFPGTKLYLLLQKELEVAGVPAKRPLRKVLLPHRLPPPVIQGFPKETTAVRLARYRMQLVFILSRLRFHLMEGLRFAWESRSWRRQKGRLAL
ncbi:nucleotidyltransferase family protein [Acidicapsa dinghuensis]|uniref:Nucleotidyltransferase family protein n=1 Tax=Acidicapsa dinghuensis TaxID=2218256 RepID=A0ABW1EDL1_9BACT|nr:nucleotidyltransferase family protein [Acidicapsa dinghuensis]